MIGKPERGEADELPGLWWCRFVSKSTPWLADD